MEGTDAGIDTPKYFLKYEKKTTKPDKICVYISVRVCVLAVRVR